MWKKNEKWWNFFFQLLHEKWEYTGKLFHLLKVNKSRNDFLEPTFPPKSKWMTSTSLLWNLRLTYFCSFFGRNWRHQKDISKLTDLYKKNWKYGRKKWQKSLSEHARLLGSSEYSNIRLAGWVDTFFIWSTWFRHRYYMIKVCRNH